MSHWLPMLGGLVAALMAALVLWPLRHHGRRGFVVGVLALGVAGACLYLLVGDPRAAQVKPTPSVATLRDGVQALQDALKRDPQRADGWALLGRSQAELGNVSAAADAFARAAALAPDDPGVLVEAAQARAQADAGKQFDDTAMAWLQQARAQAPDAERASWLLGIALRQRGKNAEAADVWSGLLPRLEPGAALALLQSERWAQREALCQALMDSLHTGDWYALLTALNHEQAPARLHWLATLLVDALKRQHGASYLTNVDADAVVAALAGPLSPARIQAILNDVCHCRDQLLHVTGLNRELVLTDLILRIEHYLQPGTLLPVPHL